MVRNTQAQVSPARSRLLGTASRLFYTEGLHSVGVDRIVAEAGTTRATLYRHFPSKDDLIVSYLEEADRAVRNRLEHTRAGGLSAADTLRAIAADIAADIRSPGFRGCAFLNAAAEYSDPAHPVNGRIVAHREWFLSTVTDLFAQIDDCFRRTRGPSLRDAAGRRDGRRLPVRPGAGVPDPPRRGRRTRAVPRRSTRRPTAAGRGRGGLTTVAGARDRPYVAMARINGPGSGASALPWNTTLVAPASPRSRTAFATTSASSSASTLTGGSMYTTT